MILEEKTEANNINYARLEVLEALIIKGMKGITRLQRLERLITIIAVSCAIKNATKIYPKK